MRFTRSRNDHGVALITVLMLLALISAMLVATTTLVVKDQRARFQDHNRTDTFYVAHAGLEKMTNDLGRAFSINYAPSTADLNAVTANPPTLGNMRFEIPGGAARSGYTINKGPTLPQTIATGPFAGLQGLITTYTMNVTAQSPAASEVSLRRTINTIAIPVFQFGIFSETDLSFFPGPTFNFGGRVHTNGNLFLGKDIGGGELILNDYVTAYKDVYRHVMANGNPITTGSKYAGVVKILTTDGGCNTTTNPTCRAIGLTEGSLTSSNVHNTGWHTVSRNTYGGFIKNGANGQNLPDGSPRGTGAQRLVLPITSGGAPAISLIRRPAANENNTNPDLFDQRYYSLASLRILLSDRASDLDNLAGHGTGTAQSLDALIPTAQAGPGMLTGTNLPWVGWPYTVANNTALVEGYIKIELQNQAGGTWTDVTGEVLALGYYGAPPAGANTNGCVGATGAVIRLQRLKDDSACNTNRKSFWSNTLYDPREGDWRDDTYTGTAASRIYLGGIMHYVELDIANLRTYLSGKRATNSIMETTGYVVYFSDRRGNHNGDGGPETGEYGFEDTVQYNNNNAPDTGEDINGNGTAERYGRLTYASVVAGGRAPFDANALVYSNFDTIDPGAAGASGGLYEAEQVARASRPIFFRRALKLVNGNRTQMLTDVAGRPKLGLTVVAENPVYIQGDYNGTFADGINAADGVPLTYGLEHVACAVIGDAVTLLSRAWNDRTSFQQPHNPGGRAGNDTIFRTAIVSGKGLAFPRPNSTAEDFGTDGGTHNFLRYLEGGSRTLYYRGSIVSLYFNHQATGTYKCCNNVYGAPTRAFQFDTDFRDPAKLPPRTPMFRTIDVTSFTRLSEPPTTP
jgi:hypothetical protein